MCGCNWGSAPNPGALRWCLCKAPCQTLSGALLKTAPGGEISILDPGGFGAVTINKSVSITNEGGEAGVLAQGTNGIIINAADTDVIHLRGLVIDVKQEPGTGLFLHSVQFSSLEADQVKLLGNYVINMINQTSF